MRRISSKIPQYNVNYKNGIIAAHCIQDKPRDILAFFGLDSFRPSNPDLDVGSMAIRPVRITIHSDWDPMADSYDADISLLKFEEGKIMFTQFIIPICIWDSIEDQPKKNGVIIGWRKCRDCETEDKYIPKLTRVTIQDNDHCFLEHSKLVKIASSRTFCSSSRNGSGFCDADGEGLFIKVDGIYYLRGIASTISIRKENCDNVIHVVNTNINKFTDWIKHETRRSFGISMQGN